MDAMMYVIVTENLHDRDFIQRYTRALTKTLCQKAFRPMNP